jgi:hypothetical protein
MEIRTSNEDSLLYIKIKTTVFTDAYAKSGPAILHFGPGLSCKVDLTPLILGLMIYKIYVR